MSKNNIDQELIRQLANILNDTHLSEIEVEHDDLRIRVAREISMNVAAPAAPAMVAPASPGMPAAPIAAQAAAQADVTPAATSGHQVASPMVGTAYFAPEPGAAPFVKVGDAVKEGQTIMIVEAMKHMNQIPADKSGTILEILVEDGQPVEYGEPLMVIG